jgi:hypothetical protein
LIASKSSVVQDVAGEKEASAKIVITHTF